MIFLFSPVNKYQYMLHCEILLKISKALKFYPIKTIFALSAFAT